MDAFERELQLWRELRDRIGGARNERERLAVLNEIDERHPGVKKFLTGLAVAVQATSRRHEVAKRALALIRDPNTGMDDIEALPPMDGPTVLTLCAMLDVDAVDRARHLIGTRGGIKSGKRSKQAARPRHAKLVQRASQLINGGCLPRKVSSFIANGDQNKARQIRTVLQDAGIVPRRKKRK